MERYNDCKDIMQNEVNNSKRTIKITLNKFCSSLDSKLGSKLHH